VRKNGEALLDSDKDGEEVNDDKLKTDVYWLGLQWHNELTADLGCSGIMNCQQTWAAVA
jgi:hypothetical protein